MAGSSRYFLRLDGISGEVTVSPWHNWIEVASFAPANGGAGATLTRGPIREIVFVAPLGMSAPKLQQFCANGKNVGSGELVAVKNGHAYLHLLMTSIVVEACNVGGGRTGTPTVSFSLNFEKSEMNYERLPEDDDQGSSISPEETHALRTAHNG
jgi:type VI protein secretion system component Hcp